VVNADSMQLYRGMDIGTAKPDRAERDGVPHHLLDLWHVRQAASVAEYRRLARAEVDRLRAADVVPLLVGGSGLYVRAVPRRAGLPGHRPRVRARLEAELAEAGPAALHARLAAVDPAAAAAVLPSNGRRVVRALEVVEITGGPFQATLPEPRRHYPAVVVGLDREPAELDERVALRVDRMWAAGFVAEVEALVADGPARGPHGVPGARATRRCWPSSTGSSPPTRRASGRCTPPAGSSAGSARGSAATRRRTWFDAGAPDLADAARGDAGRARRTIGR
jgi:tRNA dimethylallyltransferase